MKPEISFSHSEIIKAAVPPLFATAIIGCVATLCDPDRVHNNLRGPVKSVFGSLINNGNEKDQVRARISEMPDGLEEDVADRIEGFSETRQYKRAVATKSKPHLLLSNVIEQLAQSYKNREEV